MEKNNKLTFQKKIFKLSIKDCKHKLDNNHNFDNHSAFPAQS